MSFEIFISDDATEGLLSTANYIKNTWGEAALKKFKKRVDQILKNISRDPYIFQASDFSDSVRRGLITPQCSIYYQIHEEYIQVLFFWDNRQEPIF
ncbi:hypothetical protein HQ865_10430 [Mucilaginibacter mali]|uniref:Plasmid stabilization system protein ParE n=1 Tax=Mucilaginibacter mali TaxID=2740462 RepID=A0A7D4UD44_9SPHI|nr:type II toxin-antitoxin system RelE/ParE family toxin [Mucilaginibacter mali]QKJ30159.1 hypothetical protein HQ865_10430 [Mucilaginibacter mali]